MVEVAALALVAIVVGLFAWVAYVLIGCVKSITAGLTNVLNRITANDPVANVDSEGVIRDAYAGFLEKWEWPPVDTPSPQNYQDPTDDYLPDPGYTGNNVVVGEDPDWPYPGANLGGN